MSRRRTSLWIGLLWLLPALASTAHAQCLEVVDAPTSPAVPRPEVDVPQIVRLTQEGIDGLRSRVGYVVIVREAGSEQVNGTTVSWPREVFVRLIDTTHKTEFTFGRKGNHTIELFAVDKYRWPVAPDFQTFTTGQQPDPPVSVCGHAQSIQVDPAIRRPDFPGVRPQWWVAFRLPLRPEFGTAVYFRRLGFAASIENNLGTTISNARRDEGEPRKPNTTTGTFEVRYRGSRGYLGGGVRYYPHDEPDRQRVRAGFFAGEELPTWKGRRLWLMLDITLQEPKAYVKGLRVGFGGRLDLWGTKP
jgi:hypothetical protein